MKIDFCEFAKLIAADVISDENIKSQVHFDKIVTDSRKLNTGDIFLALRGESFDAHNFLNKLDPSLISFAIVDRRGVSKLSQKPAFPLLVVEDTLRALNKIASIYRSSFENAMTVAITGSNGKTTCKNFLAHVAKELLGNDFYATPKNFNNYFGVPYSILESGVDKRLYIFETGINSLNEMDMLASTLRPDISILTCVQPAHIEGLGSLEQIWTEKTILAQSARAFLYDADSRPENSVLPSIPESLTFSALDSKSDFYFDLDSSTISFNEVCLNVKVNLPGKAKVAAISSALLVFTRLGFEAVSILKACESFNPSAGRMAIIEAGDLVLIDDTYNANLFSMLNLCDSAKEIVKARSLSGKVLFVLGDMAELGDMSDEAHLKVLSALIKGENHSVYSFGSNFHKQALKLSSSKINSFLTKVDLVSALREKLDSNNISLLAFKGSRSAKMEEVISTLFPEESADA